MKVNIPIFENPDKQQIKNIIQRPVINNTHLFSVVKPIFDDIKANGEKALLKYTEQFDKVKLASVIVSEEEKQNAINNLDTTLKNAIDQATANIFKFHQAEQKPFYEIETLSGIYCQKKYHPIESVGLYIPGGSAPLFSTVLMLGIPAAIAQCKNVILCSPPNQQGNLHPAIIYAAHVANIKTILKVGGIQAIAAMVCGINEMMPAYKIFGPGNQYVNAAKQYALLHYGVGVDMPTAGPSEVLVWADKNSNPNFVAADLLAQAEHGNDSQVILVSSDMDMIKQTLIAINNQIPQLTRKEIILQALQHSRAVFFNTTQQIKQFISEYAPEHLIIQTTNAQQDATDIYNAGSIFIGNYSPESVGDYASGTNHTLPTAGSAKHSSGVSVASFLRAYTVQHLTLNGLQNIAQTVETMATAEKLDAHKNAVSIRL